MNFAWWLLSMLLAGLLPALVIVSIFRISEWVERRHMNRLHSQIISEASRIMAEQSKVLDAQMAAHDELRERIKRLNAE